MTLQYDDVRCGAAQYGRYSRQFQLEHNDVSHTDAFVSHNTLDKNYDRTWVHANMYSSNEWK